MVRELEPSVQMRLYALSKRQVVLVFGAFFMCFALTVFIGIAGPPITQSSQINASVLHPPPESMKRGPFILKSPPMSAFHQQMWLIADVVTDADKSLRFEQPFQIGMKVRYIGEDNKSDLVYDGTGQNRSRTLRCQNSCEEMVLLHLGYLGYTYYIVSVRFYGLETMTQNIKDIKFLFKSYNPAFTQLEIWFRFVFLVLTFLATCLFAHSLRKFSIRDWSIEQKWMSLLLPLLLLYNNPIFPLTFLLNSWVPSMFDALFQATFLCSLLLFWLCLYHGVRQVKRRFVTFYLPKLIVVGVIWITAVLLASWQAYNEQRDPTYNYKVDTGNFMGFKVFFFVSGGLYVLYLIYLLGRAYAELRNMPYFDLRLKFMTSLMVIVLTITITITVLRFGSSMLQDNFVAELATTYQNSAEFLSFYGLLNFYLYTMAYVYSPSKNAVFESHFRDNPTLSMLNDSDDEVVYGSDREETTSLTRKAKKFDSEDEMFN